MGSTTVLINVVLGRPVVAGLVQLAVHSHLPLLSRVLLLGRLERKFHVHIGIGSNEHLLLNHHVFRRDHQVRFHTKILKLYVFSQSTAKFQF